MSELLALYCREGEKHMVWGFNCMARRRDNGVLDLVGVCQENGEQKICIYCMEGRSIYE